MYLFCLTNTNLYHIIFLRIRKFKGETLKNETN